MMGIICLGLYIIVAVLLFLRLRLLDGQEQRERQMRVTRRRWLRRRLFYILVCGIVCGSFMTGAAGFVLGIQQAGIEIPKVIFWFSAVLIVMVLVTFYYLMALSGKVILIYFGTLILWFSLSVFLPFVLRIPQLIRVPAAWCVVLFVVWLILYIAYRKLFFKKDLGED